MVQSNLSIPSFPSKYQWAEKGLSDKLNLVFILTAGMWLVNSLFKSITYFVITIVKACV